MLRILIIPTLLIVACGCTATPHADFGEPMQLEGAAAIPVSKILDDPKSFDGQYLRLLGDVQSVCAAKG